MSQHSESPQKPAKKITPRKQPGMISSKTREAIKLINEHGVSVVDAYKFTHDGQMPANRTKCELAVKARKHALTAPAMVKLAHSVVKDTLKGKTRTYTTQKAVPGVGIVDIDVTEAPTFANQLAAASMVLDRDQPIVRHNVNANINADISPVDLSKYLNRVR